MTYLTLNQTLSDWLTLTSFNDYLYTRFKEEMTERVGALIDYGKPLKWQNYTGWTIQQDSGTIFAGEGIQKGAPHYCAWVSGELADELLHVALELDVKGFARFTRLDLQSTIAYPKNWSQFNFLVRLKRNRKSVGWAESRDRKAGALETVYIGSRSSDRITRVYVKLTENNQKLLRFETEYKGQRARQMAASLAHGAHTPSEYLAYDAKKANDKMLWEEFYPVFVDLEEATERIRVKTDLHKTEEWIRSTVFPALRRYLNDHQHNPDIAQALTQLIVDYYD